MSGSKNCKTRFGSPGTTRTQQRKTKPHFQLYLKTTDGLGKKLSHSNTLLQGSPPGSGYVGEWRKSETKSMQRGTNTATRRE